MKAFPFLPTLSTAPLAIRLAQGLTRDLLTPGEIVPATVVAALDSRRAVIQIKGRLLVAEVPFPLPERRELPLRVEQTGLRTVLRLLTATTPGEAPAEVRLTEGLTRDLLTRGETLPAAVVATLDSRRVLIRIKGREILAEVPGPFPEQGEFRVRVEQVGARTILRLLPEPVAAEAPAEVRLKACLAGNRPVGAVAEAWQTLSRIEKSVLPEEIRGAWTGFQETLKALSSRFEARSGPELFKDLVNLSGLNWENKLKGLVLPGNEPDRTAPVREDLKGLLLTLRARLEPVDPDLAQAIAPILQKIELCQWLNASDSGKYHLLLFFPWWLPEGPGWAELLLSGDRSNRKSSGEKGQSLLFLLHLPVLGKLRVEVTIRESRLYGRFKTESPEVAELLDRQIPHLKSGLSSLGYQAALESRVVDPEQLEDSLPSRMEYFPEALVSRVV